MNKDNYKNDIEIISRELIKKYENNTYMEYELLSVNSNINIKIDFKYKSLIHEFNKAILSILIIKKTNTKFNYSYNIFSHPIKNSIENREKILEFANKNSKKNPRLNELIHFIKERLESEYYYILNVNFRDIPQIEIFKLIDHLSALNNKINIELLTPKLSEYYEKILRNYNIENYGNKRLVINWNIKPQKLICRFCQKSIPNTTFKSKAHSLSEALGNKNLVTKDECDMCNKYFGETIERDIIEYFSFARTLYKIKGRKGNTKVNNKNVTFENKGNLSILINGKSYIPKSNNDELKLEYKHKIIPQNIYKALVKYSISVMNDKYLKYLKKTISWLHNDIEIKKMPELLIYTLNNNKYLSQPIINLYIRKNNNKSLPFILSEISIINTKFVLVIPFSSKDNKDFTKEKDFRNIKKHFNNILNKEMVRIDLSLNKKIKLNDVIIKFYK